MSENSHHSSSTRVAVSVSFWWTLLLPALVLAGFLGYAAIGCLSARAYGAAVLLGVVILGLLFSLWTLRSQMTILHLDPESGQITSRIWGRTCLTLRREDMAFLRLETASGRLKGNRAVYLILSAEVLPVRRQMKLDYDHRRTVVLPLTRKSAPFISRLLADTIWPTDGILTQKGMESRVYEHKGGFTYHRMPDGTWEEQP